MKRFLLFFVLVFSLTTVGWGQTFYDGFTGTGNIGGTGDLTSNNGWTTHSPTTGGGTIPITTGSLSYIGLQTPAGNKVSLPGNNTTTSRDVNAALTLGTGITAAYYSALINVLDNTQLGTGFVDNCYFMHFGNVAGTTNTTLFGRLHIKKTADGLNYRLGIQNVSGTGASQTEVTTNLDFGTTYLIVVKYEFNGAANDVATLWVNPTSIGGAEPTGGFSNSGSTSTSPATFGSVCIRNALATPKVDIDEVRAGLTWADVTPTGTIIAPTTQTSGFTFTNILQTQMNVSWTNGNGGNRVVMINTTNSFTPPADGTSPTANTTYSGSGEQVIYNGSGSTIPIVFGLTANTTYWFQSWEYNGTGSGTLYCTSAGTNNPLSQITAAAAVPPIISSPTVTAIAATSADLGGNITADGGSPILERGTVWSTTSPVTIADNKQIEGGTATGVFTHNRTGLPFNTLIYYAAFATNAAGTTLTTESSFTTLFGEPSNQASTFAATAPTFSSVVTTWLDNDGTQAATGFLVMGNTTGIFTPPTDGLQPTSDPNLGDGSGFVYVNHGGKTFTWSSLLSSTHYYFTIYAYTNTGSNINYLIADAPTTDVTTPVFIQPVAAWTFDATPAAPNTPTSVAANFGDQTGTAMLYADGTNNSSTWVTATTNNELNSFGGTLINDPREGASALAGFTYSPVAGLAQAANGKSMVFKFSMTALQDAILTFAVRGTTTGFSTHQWAWSTDNDTYTNVGPNTADNSAVFVLKTLDLTAVTPLNGAPAVYLKITFSGASTSTGNNRLDNIVIRASAASTIPPTVATTAATAVTASSATMNGTVNANNISTDVIFEYGLDNTYGSFVVGVPANITGNTTTSVSADLTGLPQNTVYHYRIKGSSTNGISNGNDLTFQTGCLFPEPAGQISGPAVVCSNNTGYVYTVPAIPNATSYIWSVPPGSEVMNMETNTVTIFFGIVSGEISVIGTNDCGDEGEPSYFTVTVNLPVAVSVSIEASANSVNPGTTVTFTATPVNGGATPSYQWKVNNLAINGATNVSYAYIPVNGDVVECIMTSSETCTTGSPATSNAITMIVNGVPADLTVTGTVSPGPAVCYNATSTITVAGGSTTFEVLPGGSATMIAGLNIIYLPGTKVNYGGTMHGYIANGGPFCTPAKSTEIEPGKEEAGLTLMDNSFKIYPNPTSGMFTIEQRGDITSGPVKVEVLGTLGGKILSNEFQGQRKHEVSIKGNSPGIYFVRISTGEKVQTVKIILTN